MKTSKNQILCIFFVFHHLYTGGSGAGKTSLMNILLGREKLTSGEINFIADDSKNILPDEYVKSHVAFVPQNDILIRDLTVFQLLCHSALTRLPASVTTEEAYSIVNDVLIRLGISHLRDKQVGSNESSIQDGLSSGDRKKVNIAVELVAGPHILFLDEPTTGE